MKEMDEYKKKIIEHFIINMNFNFFRTFKESRLLAWMELYDEKMKDALQELIKDKIIIITEDNHEPQYYLDNQDKISEIRNFTRQEPFLERAQILTPPNNLFDGFEERFLRSTERAWPNRGTYYYYTKLDDSLHWKVIIITKPNAKPTTIDMGSLAEEESRISKMWKIILEVWKNKPSDTIYKKMAEDKDQKLFGNNRQPSTACFHIFEYLGKLKEVGKYRNSILYIVVEN